MPSTPSRWDWLSLSNPVPRGRTRPRQSAAKLQTAAIPVTKDEPWDRASYIERALIAEACPPKHA